MSEAMNEAMEVEEIVSISDPGEVDRATHNWGDRFVVSVSNVFAWLFPILMVIICLQVVLRTFGRYQDRFADVPVLGFLSGIGNQAYLDDLQWWLYGVSVLVGIAYAVTTNSHVRVDILYDNFPKKKQTRISIYALGWLFLPFILLCWDVTFHYMVSSVKAWEGSSSPNGLHNLWFLKVMMNLAFVFIAFSIVSACLRYLDELVEVTGFTVMMAMLPGVVFAINLAIYYVLWWGVYLLGGAEMTTRKVTRHWLFDEVELLGYDINVTILFTLGLSAVLLAFLFVRQRKEA